MSASRVQTLASCNPAMALDDPEIAGLFMHYVNILAPWYDLNDPSRTFGTVVPEIALQLPILFKAIIAFAACHKSKTDGNYTEISTSFHDECVTDLLRSLEPIDTGFPGGKLAATCLLRSFELINDGSEVESHLLGAYSYAASEPIDFSKPGMLQAGAWNYLREEITVGLIRRRGVRMGRIFDDHLSSHPENILPADSISYLLARIMNFCFIDSRLQSPPQDRDALWYQLHADLAAWKARLPPSFRTFSSASRPDNPYPSLWMLHPWHVSAQQYLAVAEILLELYNPHPEGGHLNRRSFNFAHEQALQVCGLAWTNANDAARVNAFGPLAFSGRYLNTRHHRRALEAFLVESSLPTGWPVENIIKDLHDHWRNEYT